MSWASVDLTSFWRFSTKAAQSTVAHDSEIVLHTSQGVVVSDPMKQYASRVNVCSSLSRIQQSDVRVASVAKSPPCLEYTDVFDRMFVQTRVEHSNVVIQFHHRPFTKQIKELCRVLRSIHCTVGHGYS